MTLPYDGVEKLQDKQGSDIVAFLSLGRVKTLPYGAGALSLTNWDLGFLFGSGCGMMGEKEEGRMRKLLLITGDLATGKSTFAGQLARRYGVNVFYKDTFKEVLGDTIGFSDREGNLKLSVASAALMRMVFSEFCRLGRDLILESNFRQAELELLHEIAGEHGYEVLTVALRGDLRILHGRFLHRLYHEDRHFVHACGGFEEFGTFREYVLRQRSLQIPGRSMELSADNFDYQEDPEVLARLDRFMDA